MNIFFSQKNYKKNNLQKGFSLIELIVVLAIFLIITTVALVKQSKFSSDILVTDTAYDVSLAIREAQVYGLGSRLDEGATGQSFKSGYGVHFDASIPGFFIRFADRNVSGVFDANSDGDEQYGETQALPIGYTINDVCAYTTNTTICSNSNGGGLNTLDISFVRPSPDAIITINGNPSKYFSATISILSANGEKTKMLKVERTGLISVCQTTPCI